VVVWRASLIGLFIRSVIVRRTPLEVDAGLAGRDAEHGDAAAVRHVRDARVQRLGATRHLERDVEPFGHAKLTLDIAEVAFAWNLSEGILRMRYRESFRTPTLIVPDQVYRIEIDLYATSNLFQRGHRLRVDIVSSSFPAYDVNSNTGGPLLDARESPLIAINSVYHDREHQSQLVLPVIPASP
jgi:hypothetical protein